LLESATNADYIGEIGEAEKSEFLGGAVALLFPIEWPEPFGLVMIEAMSCGTPVIAFNRGSVPEVVEQGVTGFVVETAEDAAAAVEQALELDRARIRATFEQRFTSDIMAMNYEAAYRSVLDMARITPLAELAAAAKTPAPVESPAPGSASAGAAA
jgi:glycosyltransferase involved in cell wall biosynthesis